MNIWIDLDDQLTGQFYTQNLPILLPIQKYAYKLYLTNTSDSKGFKRQFFFELFRKW